MRWKNLLVKLATKNSCKVEDEAVEIPMPITWLYEINRNIYSDIRNENDIDRKGFLLSIMDEVLCCQTRFILCVYINLFLNQDFTDEKLDAKVLDFLTGAALCSHNDMLELCERLCRAMNDFSENDSYKPFKDKNRLLLYLGDLRLPLLPSLSALDGDIRDRYNEYAEKVISINEKFIQKKVPFLIDKQTRLQVFFRGEKIINEQELYRDKVEKYLLEIDEDTVDSERYINETGSCVLALSDCEPIRLDPILIPLKNGYRKIRMASLRNISCISDGIKSRLEYVELLGDDKRFTTNDDQLYREVFLKKGNILESPLFPYRYLLKTSENKELTIKLYDGDILNLNFLKGIRKQDKPKKKIALVNIIYHDGDKTELAEALEVVAEIKIDEIINGKLSAKKHNIISSSKVGKLNFSKIYHCPVYDRLSEKNDEKNIDDTIENILEISLKDNIEILVVPTFGSFRSGQDFCKVAEKWYKKLQRIKSLQVLKIKKDLHLEQVIFGILNKQAINDYDQVFRSKTTEMYDLYHYPVAKLLCDINSADKDENRYGLNLDLSEYISQYFVALSLRSIFRDQHLASIKNNAVELSIEKKHFLQKVLELSGLGCRVINKNRVDSETAYLNIVGKRMTVGKWQMLCHLGIEAIKGDDWDVDAMIDDNFRKKFLQTVNASLPANVRNKVSHSNRNIKINIPYDQYCEELEPRNMFMVQNAGCFFQQSIAMVLVVGFEIDEDQWLCTLSYKDLKGVMELGTHPVKKVSFKYNEIYQGPYFETGKVFLVKNLPEFGGTIEGLLDALNMHPFIIYGKCPVCANEKGLFVWYDFKMIEKRASVIYRPITGMCDLDDLKVVGEFHIDDILASFNGLLDKTAKQKIFE